MKNRSLSLYCILFLLGCDAREQHVSISPENDKIKYTGRINFEDREAPEIYWPGTSIKIKFRGDEIKVTLQDEFGKNYFNIVLDGDSLRYVKLDSGINSYTLVSGILKGEHTLELIKRTEWDLGKTIFLGLELNNAELLEFSNGNGRVIEFFGNSITAGYAIEDLTGGDSPDSTFTNNYYTYAAITARHFEADYYATVRSGIGIMISWFPLIMPELYNRLDPNDSFSRWDFSLVTPDIVVVNLFQNDSWLVEMPDYETFKQRFGEIAPDRDQIISSYSDFIRLIRSKYPDAVIICALGSMDATEEGSQWPGYTGEAVNNLNDENILTHFFPYIDKPGHPRVQDNKIMAESLIHFIEENVDW